MQRLDGPSAKRRTDARAWTALDRFCRTPKQLCDGADGGTCHAAQLRASASSLERSDAVLKPAEQSPRGSQGGTEGDLARVIGCIFFVSGLITLIQTTIGDRLPIIQVRAAAASGCTSACLLTIDQTMSCLGRASPQQAPFS